MPKYKFMIVADCRKKQDIGRPQVTKAALNLTRY